MADLPTCYVIAGPNGAGKTTFALHYLPKVVHCKNFVNADLIAAGLSPLSPEREKMSAARLLLKEIKTSVKQRESFAFETTLSGKSYLRLIHQLRNDHWIIELFYLWLPSIESSIARVKERVDHGGHHIPAEDIKRRFPRSMDNLINRYAPLCDQTGIDIVNKSIYQQILKEASYA
ncbi:MAG: hypothetical protein K0U68_08640 [Gammaproteobacteria bacterium]|nr:hypothetical protein [Gammaproteobacteria bacterium]